MSQRCARASSNGAGNTSSGKTTRESAARTSRHVDERTTRMTDEVPASHLDLLERPLFAHLATLRPDGSPQSSVMWFGWDGERVRFSHTRNRQKYRNLENDPRVSFHVQDPDNPYRTLEVRGRVESMIPDAEAAFYRSLQERYDFVAPVCDADIRGAIAIVPVSFVAVDAGLTQKEIRDLTDLMEGGQQMSPATNVKAAESAGPGR